METLEKKFDIKVKTLQEEACELSLSIEISKGDVTAETGNVFRSIQSRASLPGFRVGKAPLAMVQEHFSDRARQQVIENLVSQAASQVIREKKISSIDTPKVEKIDFDFDKALVFHLKIEKDPEIKAKNYKGLKVTSLSSAVTDVMVEKSLHDIQDRNAALIASSQAQIDKNVFAVIDFEGQIDGKAFAGGTSKDYLLDMAQPQTIAGFSEGILGAAIGDERNVDVTFPADYGRQEYAGKKATFHIKVKEIKEKKLPALDDAFAKDLGLTSLEELKTKIREGLEHDEKAKADKDLEDKLYDALLAEHDFKVPPTLVAERNRALTQRSLYNLARQGLVSVQDKQAEATLLEKTKPQAEKDVRLSYLLKAIATQEKLEAGEADIEELKKKALGEKDADVKEIEKYFREKHASVIASLTEGKVLDFLKANAKIKSA